MKGLINGLNIKGENITGPPIQESPHRSTQEDREFQSNMLKLLMNLLRKILSYNQ